MIKHTVRRRAFSRRIPSITSRIATAGALVLTAGAALMTPCVAYANLSCSGPVTYLAIDQGGTVYVGAGTAINAICSTVTQGSFVTSPQACKLFYATLLTDEIAGRSPTLYYNDSALTNCSQIAPWSNQPSAYFVLS